MVPQLATMQSPKNKVWSFLVIYSLLLKDTIHGLNNTECKCFDESGGGVPTDCPANSGLANATYKMTTAYCILEVKQEQSNMTVSIDIGLECDPNPYPLQYCESTFCNNAKGVPLIDYPFSFETYVNGENPLYGVLKLSSNGKTINTGEEYSLNVTCTTMGSTPLLKTAFSVIYRYGTTAAPVTTKSTANAITSISTSQIGIINTTTRITISSKSTQKMVTYTPQSFETLTSVRSQNAVALVASTLISARTSASSNTASKSITTFTQRHQTTASRLFFDDPAKVAAISVATGLALLAATGVGTYVVISQYCKPKLLIVTSAKSNEDSEEEAENPQ